MTNTGNIILMSTKYFAVIAVSRLMDLAKRRLKQIFLISSYNCDSLDHNGLTFPQILTVCIVNIVHILFPFINTGLVSI